MLKNQHRLSRAASQGIGNDVTAVSSNLSSLELPSRPKCARASLDSRRRAAPLDAPRPASSAVLASPSRSSVASELARFKYHDRKKLAIAIAGDTFRMRNGERVPMVRRVGRQLLLPCQIMSGDRGIVVLGVPRQAPNTRYARSKKLSGVKGPESLGLSRQRNNRDRRRLSIRSRRHRASNVRHHSIRSTWIGSTRVAR